MKEDAASQTENDFHMILQPPIRNLRDIDPQFKKACIKASVKYMSTAMGPVTVQAVREEMYDHHYYLSNNRLFKMTHPYLSIMNNNKSRMKTCLVPRRYTGLIRKINHHQARRITYHTRMCCLEQKH